MNKTLGIFLAVLVVSGLYISGKYNTLVSKDEEVKAAWSQVENQYQRRYDLVPNLVNTVKGAASHEKDTFTAVTEARAKATNTNVDIKDLESFKQFQASQSDLSSALSRLMLVVESYPGLKVNQNFLDLQSQLEGTENRISTERMRYNETVKPYNIYVRSFPNNLLAGFFHFETAQLFETNEEAKSPPEVIFE